MNAQIIRNLVKPEQILIDIMIDFLRKLIMVIYFIRTTQFLVHFGLCGLLSCELQCRIRLLRPQCTRDRLCNSYLSSSPETVE